MQSAGIQADRSFSSYPIHPFHVLEQNSVASFFEPLVSVQRMEVIGLEAVSRAVNPDGGSLIKPQDLFRHMPPEDSGLKLALDRLFREDGLESFAPFQSQSPSLLLFLGIEPSILVQSTVGSGHLLQQVRKLSLEPRQVAVQVSLSEVSRAGLLAPFTGIQRGHGFYISLRDVSDSPEHLGILRRCDPDMVRVEDRLVRGMAADRDKQQSFRRVVQTAHTLGVIVIAGGIESEEDALAALERGADLLQGGYFFRNYKRNYPSDVAVTLGRKARMQFLVSRYKRGLARRAKRDRDLKMRARIISQSLFNLLEGPPAPHREGEYAGLFRNFPALECLYLLDGEGKQSGETVCNLNHIPERKKVLFKPSPKGADHSLREYYFALNQELDSHLTDPYLSTNSGNLCLTASKIMGDPQKGEVFILCADLNISKI